MNSHSLIEEGLARFGLARTLFHAALAGCPLAACHAPIGAAPVVPQRPTFSPDTGTTAEGTLEVEAGLAWDPDGGAASPVSVKYGSGPSTEVSADWVPVLVIDRPGEDETGPGDLVLGLRHRIRDEDERASLALQARAKLPAADEDDDLGSGDAGRVGSFVELAATTVPEMNSDLVFATLGSTYAFSDSLVLDVGVTVGLNDEALDALLLIGVTRNFGSPRRPGQ